MRVRWRDFELPTRVVCNQKTLTPTYGEFFAEPFERGFGHTIANSLRRILLSTTEGCAVTSVRIEGVKHEFSSMPGVLEDVTDIILNIKKLCVDLKEGSNATLFIDIDKKGEVTGADIITDGKAEIFNKDLVIATLTTKREFQMELQVKRGRGYATAEENTPEIQDIGVIPVASIFSPVRHVEYEVENTRVGKITNYDRIILKITTDGTRSPEEALVESSKILRKHLNPFVQYFELGKTLTSEQTQGVEPEETPDKETQVILEKLDEPIENLDLGVRASNCLASEGIRYVRDLVKCTESDLLQIRNFGKTSLKEIKEKLTKRNLTLGMSLESLASEK